jgi:hypothetical protein
LLRRSSVPSGEVKTKLDLPMPTFALRWRSSSGSTCGGHQYNLPKGFDALNGTWMTGDVNGDGKTDMIYEYPYGPSAIIDTFVSTGTGSFVQHQYNLPKGFDALNGTWMTGDVNGDKKTDMIYEYPYGPSPIIDTFVSTGTGSFVQHQYNLPEGFDALNGTWMTGDVNGDKKTDMIYEYPYGPSAIIDTFVSTGTGSLVQHQYNLPKGFDALNGTWMA